MNRYIAILLLIITATVRAEPVKISIFDAPLHDFVRLSAPHLSYGVVVDSKLHRQFTMIASSPSKAAYQKLFEDVLRSQGLAVADYGRVKVIEPRKKDVPELTTLVFEHARASELVKDLNAVLQPFDMKYSVTASTVSNALIVSADTRLQQVIQKFHRERDVKRKQVYIEAIAFESTIRHLRNVGLVMKFQKGDARISIEPSLSTAGTVAYGLLGNTLSIDYNALENDSNVSVISTPSLTVQDRAEAVLDIGQEVPVITGSVRQEDGEVYQSIDRRSVGVQLRIQPTVLSDGKVAVSVAQSVSRVDQDVEASDIVFDQKRVSTVLEVANGQTVYLGGLIQDSTQTVDQGVPGLSKLPLLGNLFALDRDDLDKRVYSLLLKVVVI